MLHPCPGHNHLGPSFSRVHSSHPSNQHVCLLSFSPVPVCAGDRKLTTKVFAVRTPLGAKIYFLPTMNVLGASFREEKAIERARQKGTMRPHALTALDLLNQG